ncbi:hypothetical protein MKX03_014961, partial [Papaver bracteatum]
NAVVTKSSGGALVDKACLMALDIPGLGSSCGDRLRNSIVLDVRDFLRYNLDNIGLTPNQIETLEVVAASVRDLLAPAREDLRDWLGSLKFADWLRDCVSWCESKKDTKGISCATKRFEYPDKLYCFSLA